MPILSGSKFRREPEQALHWVLSSIPQNSFLRPNNKESRIKLEKTRRQNWCFQEQFASLICSLPVVLPKAAHATGMCKAIRSSVGIGLWRRRQNGSRFCEIDFLPGGAGHANSWCYERKTYISPALQHIDWTGKHNTDVNQQWKYQNRVTSPSGYPSHKREQSCHLKMPVNLFRD